MPQNGFPAQNAFVAAFNSLKAGLFDAKSGVRMRPAWTHSGAPTNGTSGTLAGYALPGDLLIRTDTVALYQNTNTQASPTWTAAPLTGVAAVTSGTITGTTIDNSVIGGTTPAAGAFTTIAGTAITATYLTTSEFVNLSAATGLTAAGTTRATALALTKQLNNVTTAAASTGVILVPSATVGVGGFVRVWNNGANPIKVYAAGTDTIDGTAGSTGVTLTNAHAADFTLVASGAFLSNQLGATSA